MGFKCGTIVVILTACVSVAGAIQFWDLSKSNSTKFSFNSCDGKFGKHPSTVPGLINTDLINAGIIKVDPYYRYEEVNLGWVPKNCWAYETSEFELPYLDVTSELFLRFDGVDSIASVFINNILIGNSANALRSHTFAVDPKVILKSNNNVLRIELANAIDHMKAKAEKYPYVVPETQNWNVWVEPSNRNFLRKAGCDMGWDWGPAFVPCGLTGDVYFFQETNDIGKLEGVAVTQTFNGDLSEVVLDVKVQISSIPTTYSPLKRKETGQDPLRTVSLKVLWAGGEKEIQHSFQIGDKDTAVVNVGSLVISNPALWWPIGNGAQVLHTIEVQYSSSSVRRSHAQSITRRIGLRKVELVQEVVTTTADQEGSTVQTNADGTLSLYTVTPRSFFFRINNHPVFMRGANFIPIDVFESRVTREDRAYIMRAAVQSNMNMLRVWGGGRYQPDDFYDLADELGVLVWQEVMLACALYPTDKAFLAEISAEVTEQAFRLGTHPSIVIWGGNNENEVALQWFTESNKNRDLYVADYSALYGGTVFPALTAVIGEGASAGAAWVDSSPSNGLISTDPYSKLWGTASTPLAGDVHFYDYNCDCEDFSAYPTARFVSEFGFQTSPSFLTYKPVTAPEDWSRDSDLMLYRQRHEAGNPLMEDQITKHFNLPAQCSDSASREFDMYLYLTGIQQSRCYETAVNRWRQLRSVPSALTMGILYWQLNDIWQGPSWASIEWGGRWKPVQYAMKRSYAPVVVTMSSVRVAGKPLEVHGVNDDLFYAASIAVTVELVPWVASADIKVSQLWSGTVEVAAGSSQLLWQLGDVDAAIAALGCSRETCYVKASATATSIATSGDNKVSAATTLYPTFAFLAEVKNSALAADASVSISAVQRVSDREVSFDVTVSATSPFLFLELADDRHASAQTNGNVLSGRDGVFGSNAGWFSDNNFVAEAGQTYRLTYTSFKTALTPSAFQSRVQARVLQHAYNCDAKM